MQNRVAKYEIGFGWQKRQYYMRDAQGNVLATYNLWRHTSGGVTTIDSVKLMEQHIYGSARVGMVTPELMLYPTVPVNPHASDSIHYEIYEGWKRYEITNHLGNVLAVITDRKRGRASSGSNIQWFVADVLATQQYYPFGMLMPGNASATLRRQYSLSGADYRYGFNGKEGDDEVKGDDNHLDFGARPYDPRSGRWLGVDPLAKNFPRHSPYSAMANNPIYNIDKEGKYFTGNEAMIKDINRVYQTAYALGLKGDKRMEEFAASLKRMEASEIEFHLKSESQANVTSIGGETEFDFDNNRVEIIVFAYTGGQQHAQSESARIAHELEHGRQFMDGEIGFLLNTRSEKRDKVVAHYLDQNDERKALLIGFLIEKEINKDMAGSAEDAAEKSLRRGYSKLSEEDLKVNVAEVDENCGIVELLGRIEKKPPFILMTNYNYIPNEKQRSEYDNEKNKIKND